MGRGNVCVSDDFEGLYYVDNDYLHIYRTTDTYPGEPEYKSMGDLDYEEICSDNWEFDEIQSRIELEDTEINLTAYLKERFKSFVDCKKWIEHDRYALLENNLFYIAEADNQWSMAFMLIQKDHPYMDLSGLQQRHYQTYLDGIRDGLFEMFPTLGTYAGAWTSGTIRRQ